MTAGADASSVAAVSCDPSDSSSWAACGPRLAKSQRAALTPPTGHWWQQEHLNPVKGFALLPPTPLFGLLLLSTSVLEQMPAGIIKGKSKLGWGEQKSEMMTLAKKSSFLAVGIDGWLLQMSLCHLALCWLSCFWNIAYRLRQTFQAQWARLTYQKQNLTH